MSDQFEVHSPASPVAVAGRPRSSRRLLETVQQWGLGAALVALIAVGSVTSPYFLTLGNIVNILRQTAVLGLLAMGVTLALISGALDFTVGSMVALVSILIGRLQGEPMGGVFLLILVVAVAVGLLNGLLIARLRLESFIVTLGLSLAVEGIAHLTSHSQTIPVTTAAWRYFGAASLAGMPVPILIFVAMAVLLHLVLSHTVFGRSLYAVGGNEVAARIAGIMTGRVKMVALVGSAIIAAIAGIVFTGRVATGDPTVGTVMALDAVVIAVLGGASLHGGKGTMAGAVIAALLLSVLFNVFNMLNFPVYVQMMTRGVLLVAAIALQRPQR